jgi:tetratricopeptide (TPR) repeat protein
LPVDRDVTLRQAEKLLRQGRLEAAIAEYVRVLEEDPDDWDTAETLADLHVRAGENDRAAAMYSRAAGHFAGEGSFAKAAALYRKILQVLPEDKDARSQLTRVLSKLEPVEPSHLSVPLSTEERERRVRLAKTALGAGDYETARRHLDRGTAGNDTALLLMAAEIELSSGALADAREVLKQVLSLDLGSRDQVVELAWTLLDTSPDAAYVCVDCVVDAASAASEYGDAAAVLQEFVARTPAQIAQLVKLVDVCVKGGLEGAMYDAQAQLTDMYLAAGQASEARKISEDLVAREPWETANIDRFRRALVMLGVDDPDALIAERLSGLRPFTATDPFADPADPSSPPAVVPMVVPERNNLDEVFQDIRNEAAQGAGRDRPVQQMTLAQTYLATGMIDEAIAALEAASHSPRCRYEAGMTLARLFKDRGDLPRAIEWLERAAEVPAPSAAEGRALLYELGATLEQTGETGRALAVFLELQADAGDYRDVAARVDRLARVQTGG